VSTPAGAELSSSCYGTFAAGNRFQFSRKPGGPAFQAQHLKGNAVSIGTILLIILVIILLGGFSGFGGGPFYGTGYYGGGGLGVVIIILLILLLMGRI
jgi:hypothetical protein